MAWVRSSNIHWCEAETHNYAASWWVAEAANTLSNLAYLCAAAHWLRPGRLPSWPLRRAQWALVGVGLGSCLFHATQTFAGELLDEIPMSVLAGCYLEALRLLPGGHAHWLWAAHGLVAGCWLLYWQTGWFVVFEASFTAQVALAALISFVAGGRLGVRRLDWWRFLLALGGAKVASPGLGALSAAGQGLWECERWLYRAGQCPDSIGFAGFWLHPMWHLGTAAAHWFWTRYALAVLLAARTSAVKKS